MSVEEEGGVERAGEHGGDVEEEEEEEQEEDDEREAYGVIRTDPVVMGGLRCAL